ncbi:UDP-2,4-diacetamido-2,4,6-trideoxy-beta-L-altropyranose hydrolase [Ureibacillus aquaedulcis]|uniref:UDP-2,4-diacetamido-2,4, 6-trideoxy-beta-L-altropyranose hydrolase n=1 Tax=Ureibacillus aquaedulcis TaxID=3058421 RepID=A0ABT8GLD0_9BACL|nr:UDP-2,4-diacetamido-2,4,6-trideoxy-beta-L-altropyranose hydrolase [Ureibacillus sp. BA0131]MDN4492219.1 UDP-2,4-diacetamido-2,4,6-trideoxy-beta-L-altropyranose hydrolase [Ureibacillus sp. BA0131]
MIIRTDASTNIGSGHVMRCLTIAKNLEKQNVDVIFWMKDLPGHLINYVQQEGFETINRAEKAELYLIDHYNIDEEWEKDHRQYTDKIVVIDDLANRPHDCDLILDQNFLPNFESRYDELVPKHCIRLLGPKYLIMRDEFIEARLKEKERNNHIERILVFMGGSDPTDETIKILKALSQFGNSFEHIDVVVGNGNINKEEIKRICDRQGYDYHCQIDYMAKLMQKADFSIGAGGSTTWERCYVGLPSSSTIVAENQALTTKYAHELGAVLDLGWHEKVTVETYVDLLLKLKNREVEVNQIGRIGLSLTENTFPNPWIDEVMELLT